MQTQANQYAFVEFNAHTLCIKTLLHKDMELAVRAFTFSPLCSVVCCLSRSPDQQLWRAFIYLCQWTHTHTHTLLPGKGANTSNVPIHGFFCVGWLICHNGLPFKGKLPCSVCCCAFCLFVRLVCLMLVLPECFIHSVNNNWVAIALYHTDKDMELLVQACSH